MRNTGRATALIAFAACTAANCTYKPRDLSGLAGGAGMAGVDSGGEDAGASQQTGGHGAVGGLDAASGAPTSDAAGESPGGSASVGELAIVTASLPDAALNIAYHTRVLAEGGSGEGYTFTLDGKLPSGLSLTSDGTIAGTPLETGQFSVTVSVKDSSGSQVSRDFSVKVTRKRWLVYTSDELTAKQDLLYAVDLSNSLLPRTS